MLTKESLNVLSANFYDADDGKGRFVKVLDVKKDGTISLGAGSNATLVLPSSDTLPLPEKTELTVGSRVYFSIKDGEIVVTKVVKPSAAVSAPRRPSDTSKCRNTY